MSYTLKASWQHEEESEYDSLGNAVEDAADVLRRHPNAVVYVEGDGAWVAIQVSQAKVEA